MVRIIEETTPNQLYKEKLDIYGASEQERLHQLLRQAVDEVARRYEHKYLTPSLIPFVIARMVHRADPSFSEALALDEFNKSVLDFIEPLDRATRGRFSLSHVWKM